MKILEFNTFVYTDEQRNFLEGISAILDKYTEKELGTTEVLLQGFAGTGKSSIATNVIQYRNYLKLNKQTILDGTIVLAPTNKAVQVLSNKLKGIPCDLSTLHLAIYGAPVINPETGEYEWKTQGIFENKLIIVDEASMIDQSLLDDLRLICKNCLIIYMGDEFQLEPVGKPNDLKKLEIKFFLTEVKRQDNTILNLATKIRSTRRNIYYNQSTEDINIVSEQKDFLSNYISAFKENDDSVIIVATNDLRNQLNNYARELLDRKDILVPGDKLLSIANSTGNSNGDLISVEHCQFITEVDIAVLNYDKYVDLKLYLYIINNEPSIFIKDYNKPSLYHNEIQRAINKEKILEYDQYTKFYMNSEGELVTDRTKLGKQVNIFTYGYCISCHKSQGSEFNNVFVYQNYKAPTWDGAKWFYTAITRSKNKLTILPNKKLQIGL